MKTAELLNVEQLRFDAWTGNTGIAAVGITGSAVLLSGVYLFYRFHRGSKFKAVGGKTEDGIERSALRKAFADYKYIFELLSHLSAYSLNGAAGDDGSELWKFVETFFDVSGRFNELGWGESFHSTVELAGKSVKESEAVYETRLATLCKLRPKMRCLDVGCGIGAPMRTIAAFSGSQITGLDFDQHCIERTNTLNRQYGLDSICSGVCMNMHSMEIPNDHFDAAYSIETICYSPDPERVYKEIFRVIKPGSIFVSYEVVQTPLYEPTHLDHVKTLADVTFGSGLADLRSIGEYIDAAKRVGFEHISDYDVALESKVNSPWYKRLKNVLGRGTVMNRWIVEFVTFIGWMTPEAKRVHDMLVDSGSAVVLSGKSGIMTPMHLIVLKKPESGLV